MDAGDGMQVKFLVLAHHFLDFVTELEHILVQPHVIFREFEVFLTEQLCISRKLEVDFFKLLNFLGFGKKQFILLIREFLDIL